MKNAKALLAQIKQNQARLHSCARHQFNPSDFKPGKLNQKFTCIKCGGTLKLSPDITRYIEGYEAAGGDADDIWRNFRIKQEIIC